MIFFIIKYWLSDFKSVLSVLFFSTNWLWTFFYFWLILQASTLNQQFYGAIQKKNQPINSHIYQHLHNHRKKKNPYVHNLWNVFSFLLLYFFGLFYFSTFSVCEPKTLPHLMLMLRNSLLVGDIISWQSDRRILSNKTKRKKNLC